MNIRGNGQISRSLHVGQAITGRIQRHNDVSGTVNIDLLQGRKVFVSLATDVTLVLTNPQEGGQYVFMLRQNVARQFNILFPSNVINPPSMSTVAVNASVAITLEYDGTNFYVIGSTASAVGMENIDTPIVLSGTSYELDLSGKVATLAIQNNTIEQELTYRFESFHTTSARMNVYTLDNSSNSGHVRLRLPNNTDFCGHDRTVVLIPGMSYILMLQTIYVNGSNRVQAELCDINGYNLDLQLSNIRYYVDINATGNNDGSNWANAFTSAIDAMNIAKENDTIWIARGTYLPTTTNNRTISFPLKPNMKVYGGFAGNECTLGERNVAANTTILSGLIGSAANESTYNVVYGNDVQNAEIHDLTIINGYADHSDDISRHSSGGGLHIAGTRNGLKLNNVTISNCFARHSSGAIHYGTGGHIDIQNSLLENNSVQLNYAISSFNCHVFLSNTTVRGNRTIDGTFGAIGLIGSNTSAIIVNCSFTSNTFDGTPTANGFGASLYVANIEDSVIIDQSTFDQNFSEFGAIAIQNTIGPIYVVNSIVTNNQSATITDTHGIYIETDNIVKVVNNTFYNQNGLSITVADASTGAIDIANNIIQGGSVNVKLGTGLTNLQFRNNRVSGTVENNSGQTINFTVGETTFTDTNDFVPTTPEVYHAGLNTAYNEISSATSYIEAIDLTKDRLGLTRIVGTAIDLGAVERQGGLNSIGIGVDGSIDATQYVIPLVDADYVEKTVVNGTTSLSFTVEMPPDANNRAYTYLIKIDNTSNSRAIETIEFPTTWNFPIGQKPTGMAVNSVAYLKVMNQKDTAVLATFVNQ